MLADVHALTQLAFVNPDDPLPVTTAGAGARHADHNRINNPDMYVVSCSCICAGLACATRMMNKALTKQGQTLEERDTA